MAGEKIENDILAEAADLQMRRDRGDFLDDDVADPDKPDPDKVADPDKPDPDKVADPDADPDKPGVPYARFREVNDAAQAARDKALILEGENNALRRQLATGKPAEEKEAAEVIDVKALRRAAKEAMLEGDIDKASELDDKADAEVQRVAENGALARFNAQKAEEDSARERADMVKVGADMVKKYPFLDSNGPDADRDAIDDVIARREANVAKGMTQAEALAEAAERIGKLVSAANGAPLDKGNDGKGTKTPDQIRRESAITRSAAAAAAQPAAPTGGRGERGRGTTDAVDVAKLSDKEFAALPESERALLRGDTV